MLGDSLLLLGSHLSGDIVTVVFRNHRMPAPQRLVPAPGAAGSQLTVALPAPASPWVAGLYSVAVEVVSNGPPARTLTSAEMPLAIAPEVDGTPSIAAGSLTVSCQPPVLAEQRVSLVLGDRELPSAPRPSTTSTLGFDVSAVAPGAYRFRLRVDGVDSNIVDLSTVPPSFDPASQVALP